LLFGVQNLNYKKNVGSEKQIPFP